MKHAALLYLTVFVTLARAQVNVRGTIIDKDKQALPGAVVKLLNADSSVAGATQSDLNGVFIIAAKKNTAYTLVVQLLSYKNRFKRFETTETDLDLGNLTLRDESKKLDEVIVTGVQKRGEQKGDTTSFNSGAYKTNPDATAEDLVKKMPGVTSDNTGVKVNGETVQKVLVDGKPFFGDDPNAALKNIPSEIIDRVEIFDKMSDQSAFTGFNDGDQQKTINLVTKKGRNKGQFGKVNAGGGVDANTNARYSAGSTLNSFSDKRRISLLLMSNNINQQNFSVSDITGAMGSQGGRGGMGGRGGGGFGPSNSLMVSPQSGNTTTHSGGLNYSDTWGKKTTVSGSYFYNYSNNKNVANLVRNYFTGNNTRYYQNNDNSTINQNHRINLRIEYTMDSANKITLTPSLSFQDNEATSLIAASNVVGDNVTLSKTNTSSRNTNLGYDFNNNLLFQHKFKKNGRTLSSGINTQLSERINPGKYNSQSIYNDTVSGGLDQIYGLYSYTKKASLNLAYTEPLNKFSQVQVNYNPSYTLSKSDKSTKDYDTTRSDFTNFNSALSNKYDNEYMTQRAGLGYRYQKNKLNLSLGLDAQQSQLSGQQSFPVSSSISYPFQNLLPNAQLNYRSSKSRNLRIYYRSNTNIPGISQLQSVTDISNPLLVKTGNAQLKQTFENNLNIRYGGYNVEKAKNLMLFINGSSTSSYISNATYILKADTILQGTLIRKGSQLSKPVNLNGYYSGRAFFVYGFPIRKLKSNLSLSGGFNYGRTPAIINDLLNYSGSYSGNGGLSLSSNISESLDFTLLYNGSYTAVKNTVQTSSDNSYYTHTASLKINYIFRKKLVLNTEASHTQYNGLSQSYNQQYLLWNAYIGYKFLKNNALEAKISAFDLLNQNRSINRTITSSYTEDSYTSVLRKYYLLTVTYTFRNFKSGTPPKTDDNPPPPFPGGPPPQGFPPRNH